MYIDEEPRTKNHKTRLAKVELYLEVPTAGDNDKILGPDGTLDIIEGALNEKGILFTSFGDINLSQIFDDNITQYKSPVGYLTPDGKWFVIEENENGLAHLSLSQLVYNIYYDTEYIQAERTGISLEDTLEKNGFIKVHTHDIRYICHIPIHPYSNDDLYSPNPTEVQKEQLIWYSKLFNFDGCIWVNEMRYNMGDFIRILKQGDELSIRKLFEL